MIIIPAIDLLDGVCVRLTRGNYDRITRYSTDPVEVARGFEAAGAQWLHLVDLDAARGSPDTNQPDGYNRGVIRAVARAVSCKIEVGGGIRSLRDVEACLNVGAAGISPSNPDMVTSRGLPSCTQPESTSII